MKSRKQIKFPIAKIREDGTPAIWLTHTYWMVLESGIVRKYLERRELLGAYLRRCEERKVLGENWKSNKRLKDWASLDSWPSYLSDVETAMELFTVGYEAWGRINSDYEHKWTPSKLQARGDQYEKKRYEEETKLIEEGKANEQTT